MAGPYAREFAGVCAFATLPRNGGTAYKISSVGIDGVSSNVRAI